MIDFECPRCSIRTPAPFTGICGNCGLDASGLAGTAMTTPQETCWIKHTELIRNESISIPYGLQNASFYPHIVDDIYDRTRFIFTYGQSGFWTPTRGPKRPILLSCFNEPVGEGTYVGGSSREICNSIIAMSPGGTMYGHLIPATDSWIAGGKFALTIAGCKVCGAICSTGHTICDKCREESGSNWRQWLDPSYIQSICDSRQMKNQI